LVLLGLVVWVSYVYLCVFGIYLAYCRLGLSVLWLAGETNTWNDLLCVELDTNYSLIAVTFKLKYSFNVGTIGKVSLIYAREGGTKSSLMSSWSVHCVILCYVTATVTFVHFMIAMSYKHRVATNHESQGTWKWSGKMCSCLFVPTITLFNDY